MRTTKMSALNKFLLVAGILLLIAGFGVQIAANSNSGFRELSDTMSRYGLGKITPERVESLLNSGITVLGSRVTMTELVSMLGLPRSETQQITAYARVYAATPIMVKGGLISFAIGAVLRFIGKRRGTAGFSR